MIEDEKIIEMFFERSEQGIRELDIKYGKVCHKLSYNIVNSRQDAEECVNDAYLGAWNAIPPANPHPLLTYICKIVRNISLKIYYRKEAAKRNSTYTIAMEEIEACIADPNTVEAELDKMQKRIDRLMDMRMDGEITADVFMKQSTETQMKIDSLKDEIEALMPKKEDTVTNYSEKMEMLRFALSQYNAPEYFENGIPESVIDA